MQTKDGALKSSANKLKMPIEEFVRRINSGQKRCTKCKEWKSISEFGIDNSRHDKLKASCKTCNRVKERVITKGRPSPMKGKKFGDDFRKKLSDAHFGEKNHRWKGGGPTRGKGNPIKIRARRAVNHEVEAGRMPRATDLPCVDCGNPAKQYDHYKGYEESHWLDVEARCIKCHFSADHKRKKNGLSNNLS